MWPANFASDSESVLRPSIKAALLAHRACRVMSRNILPISAPRKKKLMGGLEQGRCDTSHHLCSRFDSEADKHHAPIPATTIDSISDDNYGPTSESLGAISPVSERRLDPLQIFLAPLLQIIGLF